MLLLDEPVTGLDPAATAELYDVIRDLNRKHGVAVVMVSHDLGGAEGRDACGGDGPGHGLLRRRGGIPAQYLNKAVSARG